MKLTHAVADVGVATVQVHWALKVAQSFCRMVPKVRYYRRLLKATLAVQVSAHMCCGWNGVAIARRYVLTGPRCAFHSACSVSCGRASLCTAFADDSTGWSCCGSSISTYRLA